MSARLSILALLSASLVACAVAGCATETVEEEDDSAGVPGDSTSEDQLVTEHQLSGSELPSMTVALSFDDGPGPRTVELVDYLASKGIPATFFINGNHVPGKQAALDAEVNRGMIIGNHTQNHLLLTHQTADKVISEVNQTDAIIAAVQPNGPWIFRAPFGGMNGAVSQAMNRTDNKKYIGSIFWDMGGELTATTAADWDCWGKHVTVQRCGELYLQEIRKKKKGIILMHDIHNPTIDMVKTVVVPALIADGFKFAALPDVPSIKRALGNNTQGGGPTPDAASCSSSTLGKPVAEKTCVQSRNDQKWYVCDGGDWKAVSGADDAKCAGQKYPLAQ
jgi:peptidoglycan/xylan/chitin deacetylase (PgdA/CDA1 family)